MTRPNALTAPSQSRRSIAWMPSAKSASTRGSPARLQICQSAASAAATTAASASWRHAATGAVTRASAIRPTCSRAARRSAAPGERSRPSASSSVAARPGSGAGGLAARRWLSTREPEAGAERREGVERHLLVVGAAPLRGLSGVDAPAQHELAVPRPSRLVAQRPPRRRIEVGQRGGRLLVVLVLEPPEPADRGEASRQARRLLLPGPGEGRLGGVLGADLEQEAKAVAGDGHLEVLGLLVAAPVGSERDPRVVGRVHGTPGVSRHVGEDVALRDAGQGRG